MRWYTQGGDRDFALRKTVTILLYNISHVPEIYHSITLSMFAGHPGLYAGLYIFLYNFCIVHRRFPSDAP